MKTADVVIGVLTVGDVLNLESIGSGLQTGIADGMIIRLQDSPFVFKALHPVAVVSLDIARIGQRRETDGQRLVRLVESDARGLGDVCIEHGAVGCRYFLVVHQQARKAEANRMAGFLVLAAHLYDTVHAAQEDSSVRTLDSRVPIEALAEQSFTLTVINKCIRPAVIDGQPIGSGNPQSPLLVLYDSLHAIVRQSVVLGQRLEVLPTVVIDYAPVQSVAIAAQPQGAILGFAEAGDFVNDQRPGIVQLVTQQTASEQSVLATPGTQVDDTDARETTQPELTGPVDVGTYAAPDVTVMWKRVFHPSRTQVVEEHPIVGAYPQGIVILVVSQRTDVVGLRHEVGRHLHMGHPLRVNQGDDVDPPTPCAYPQMTSVIRCQHRHGIVRKCRLLRSPMGKVTMFRPAVQSPFHGSDPESAVGLHIHGIDGMGRQRPRLLGTVNIVAEHQRLGRQLDDTSRLGAYPQLAAVNHQAAYEVAGQCSPARKSPCMLMQLAHTPKRTHQQGAF